MKTREARIIEEILRRPSPQGYYVIPAKKEARDLLKSLGQDIRVEEAGDTVIVLTRSRSTAHRVALLLLRRGLLSSE